MHSQYSTFIIKFLTHRATQVDLTRIMPSQSDRDEYYKNMVHIGSGPGRTPYFNVSRRDNVLQIPTMVDANLGGGIGDPRIMFEPKVSANGPSGPLKSWGPSSKK